MKMDPRGRQYVSWIIDGGDELMTFDVTFDNTNWNLAETVGVVTTTTPELGTVVTGLKVRVLVRGPEAPDWAGSILLALGVNRAKLRVTDSPEIIIEDAGSITVK